MCVSPGCGDSTCNAPGPHFPLADTDERTCSNGSTGTIACPAPGQAYYGQDAQYGWDSLHLESERFTRSLSVASQPVVLDNVTGLTWQGCAAGRTGSDCATGQFATYTWQDAVAYCDALDWGGYQDWHLPDPYELDSIVDAGPTGFDTTAFPAASKAGISTGRRRRRLVVPLGPGGGGRGIARRMTRQPANCSLCSGKGGTATSPFSRDTSVATEPVVVDNVTGLTWQGCTQGLSGSDCTIGTGGSLHWVDALSYCEGSRGAAVRTGVCPTGRNFTRFGTTGSTIRQSTPAHFRPRLKTTPSGRRRVNPEFA